MTTKPPFDPTKVLFKTRSTDIIEDEPQKKKSTKPPPQEKKPEAPTSVSWKDPKRQKASESRAAKSKKKYGPKKDYSKSYQAIGARARSDAQAKETSGSSGQEGPDDIDIANERIFKALAARRNA